MSERASVVGGLQRGEAGPGSVSQTACVDHAVSSSISALAGTHRRAVKATPASTCALSIKHSITRRRDSIVRFIGSYLMIAAASTTEHMIQSSLNESAKYQPTGGKSCVNLRHYTCISVGRSVIPHCSAAHFQLNYSYDRHFVGITWHNEWS